VAAKSIDFLGSRAGRGRADERRDEASRGVTNVKNQYKNGAAA